jgi:hypothetical protein
MMTRRTLVVCAVLVFFIAGASSISQDDRPKKSLESFYTSSLHFTNRGHEFIYSKEQGGIERITGLSVEEMGCMKSSCHVSSCDECHRRDVDGKPTFSVDQARSGAACQRCHPVEADTPDAHFRRGMKCMDCHSAREVMGDGVAYDTYMQPGAMDTRCENCHTSISQSRSHTVHGDGLECSTCHVKEFPTCFNCHLGAALAKKRPTSIRKDGPLFLVNRGGKVTLGNFISYVYENKTMITLAPHFPHSITREGRRCEDCHGIENVKTVDSGTLEIAGWENGELQTVEGIVPIVENMKWNLVFLDKDDENNWTPIENPAEPLVNFSGYCSPLTRDQLAALVQPMAQ